MLYIYYDKLLEWKSFSNGRTALLIDGAGRVGKSHLAETFAKNEYRSFMIINFSSANQKVRDIFENDFMDLDLFFNKLSFMYGVTLFKRESLIIFDEVQRYPKARELIKFLVADGRYDYMETGSLMDRVKNTILELYRQDIIRFASGYESRVQAIFDEIPAQLSKKEKKFSITSLGKDSKMRTYEDAFMWLTDGMIINNCYNATDPTVGLSMYMDVTSQKCYMADTGLLVTHAVHDNDVMENELYRAVLLDSISVNQGMLMENIVAQAFRRNGRKLYFYSRNDAVERKNHMEIDFLILQHKRICPVEVKSSRYKTHSSLDKFREKFKGKIGQAYVLYTKDLKLEGDILYLPIYMAMFL